MPSHFCEKRRAVWYAALAASSVTTSVAAATEAGEAVSISTAGWTVTVNPVQSVLRVAHERLGTLMRDVRLNLSRGHAAVTLRNWSVERTAANRIQIVTTDPRTAWVVELTPDILAISCTSIDATLTAAVPAPAGRMPVRLMDTAGTPVSWAGTGGGGSTHGRAGGRNPPVPPPPHPQGI